MDSASLQRLTVPELKELAKTRGIRGYSKLRKAELLQVLQPEDDTLESLNDSASLEEVGKALGRLAMAASVSQGEEMVKLSELVRVVREEEVMIRGRVERVEVTVRVERVEETERRMSSIATSASSSPDKLYFYSRSADSPLPGRGTNEVIHSTYDYSPLAAHKGWRRVLSNFHVCPFEYKDLNWNSIEHLFQASKISIANPDQSYLFTLDSNSSLGSGDGAEAQKHRKVVKLNQAQLHQWEGEKEGVMFEAALAKYRQCPEAAEVLLATGDAELWHTVPRGKAVRFTHLEEVRAMLRG